MKKIVNSIVLFAFSLFHESTMAASPSYDCTKASQKVENIICQSDKLARQDQRLANIYNNVMEKLTDDVNQEIKTEQLHWLKMRNQTCDLYHKEVEACLIRHYQQRSAELSTMLTFSASNKSNDNELKILRITPKGNDVIAGRQIVFQFDRPVVAIGRMERNSKDIPIAISPALNCEWRWLNTSALACQLREEHKMHQATLYKVVVGQGIKTENGAQLKNKVSHTFTTTRPKVTYTRFINWLSPGTPLIQVTFNQPVTKDSVERSLFMTARGAEGSDSVQIIAYPDNMPRELPWWMAMTSEGKEPRVYDQPSDIKKVVAAENEARKVWVIEPKKELPLANTIWLNVKPGLKSTEGQETGIEKRTAVSFETYPEFEFIGLRCTLKGERHAEDIPLEKLIKLGEDKPALKRCAPLSPVALIFSSPVMNSMVKAHVDFTPRLDGNRKDYDPWENTHDWTRLSSPHRIGRRYQIWLPELLKAYQKYTVNFDKIKLKDEFGRQLNTKLNFNFYTDHRAPELKVNHNYAVLEKGVESDVPLYVTNLEGITITYDKLGAATGATGIKKEIQVNPVENIAYAIPMNVRELLGNETGILYGGLHPRPVPPTWHLDPKILAQVTPYQVHLKVGHFNSQAWVTTFAKGEPVKGAKVSLYKGSYDNLLGLTELKIIANTNKNGLAELPGLSEIDPNLEFIYGGYRVDIPGFFVKIEYNNDIAVIPLNSHFSVRGNGAYPRIRENGGHTHAWGTTAQGIYKLGDTVQFKIYVREQSNKHWVSPKKEGYYLQVFDPQNKVVFENKKIILNKFGAFDGEFKVAEQGAVGWYKFKLMPAKLAAEKRYRFTWSPMSVLVSDFTPSPFKVTTELNGALFKANDQVEVASLATLHSGGPFTEAEIRWVRLFSNDEFLSNFW